MKKTLPLAALLLLAATPAFAHPGHGAESFAAGVAHPLSGLKVAALTSTVAEQLGLGEEAVERGGAVVAAGFRVGGVQLMKGDIIGEVNGRPVTSLDELERLLSEKTRKWQIIVRRGGGILTLSINM